MMVLFKNFLPINCILRKLLNMKKFLTIIIFVFGALQMHSQTNKQMAYNYIRKANRAIEKSIDYTEALVNFNKAVKLLGVIKDKNIAGLGARTYFEIHHKQRTLDRQIKFLEQSNLYSKQYFLLASNKSSNDYQQNLELYGMARKALKILQHKAARKRMAKF